ncbi:MAG: hypothetical protein ACUVRS_02155 [Armatimonadota bacterium]
MGSNVCHSCKNASTCTYPRNVLIFQCEEYEYAEPQPKTIEADSEKISKELEVELEVAEVC